MLLEKYVYGGVYGLAVGDALGVPVEFTSREARDQDPVRELRGFGTHNQPRGTWSDDTSMVLATMDAMIASGLSYGMIMSCFGKWLNMAKYTAGGKVFDVGGTTFNAINNFLMGEDIESCGEISVNSNGNGSLMRMLPMVLYLMATEGIALTNEVVDKIYKLSGLTHAHIISKMCCVYYVHIGRSIIVWGYQKGLRKAIQEAIEEVDEYYRSREGVIPYLPDIINMDSFVDSIELDRDEVKSTGFVVDSLEASIWCLCNTSSYRDAVELAVNLGGDTDTIGAITGSLAGLYYGVEGIPKEWLVELQSMDFIKSICDRFYNQFK